MVDGGSDERETESHTDSSLKIEYLGGNVALVVEESNDSVIHPHHALVKHGIGRDWTVDENARFLGVPNSGFNFIDFFSAKKS